MKIKTSRKDGFLLWCIATFLSFSSWPLNQILDCIERVFGKKDRSKETDSENVKLGYIIESWNVGWFCLCIILFYLCSEREKYNFPFLMIILFLILLLLRLSDSLSTF